MWVPSLENSRFFYYAALYFRKYRIKKRNQQSFNLAALYFAVRYSFTVHTFLLSRTHTHTFVYLYIHSLTHIIHIYVIIAVKHAIPLNRIRHICPTEQILLLYCRLCHKISLSQIRKGRKTVQTRNERHRAHRAHQSHYIWCMNKPSPKRFAQNKEATEVVWYSSAPSCIRYVCVELIFCLCKFDIITRDTLTQTPTL